MTQLSSPPVPAETTKSPLSSPRGGRSTFGRLLRFALANLRRKPERAAFAVAGIGLAVAAVVIVRMIAAAYQTSGAEAVEDATHGAPYWVVAAGGVRFDAASGVLLGDGRPPAIRAPSGWTISVTATGKLPGHDDIALTGDDRTAPGVARVTPLGLERLGVSTGERIQLAGESLLVRELDEAGAKVAVPYAVATAAGATSGWATLTPPAAGARATAADVGSLTGLRVTSDPAMRPGEASAGLVYATRDEASRAGFLSFEQKFAAVLGGQVGSSVFGLIAQVALVLGFVIAVTSFVASVRERRREFGIMASIGLTDEVLYFFLVESAFVFVVAYVTGVLVAAGVVVTALPGVFGLGAWLQAAGLVAMYLPALAIVAALIPVHRLLQQRPVQLLTERE